MIGLMIISAFLLYLLISLGVILAARGWARRTGRSPARWGWIAALGMYLLVFWDWIPTLLVHKYYCSAEAGFWIYKTVDQWKAENPGVMETLVANKGAPSARQGSIQNYTDTYFLNQRFNWVVKKTGPLLFNRWRWEDEILDIKTNEVLARYVDFSTGNGNIGGELPIRFWLQIGHCTDGQSNMYSMETLVGSYTGHSNRR